MDPNDAIMRARWALNSAFQAAAKDLLEQRHLYQSVTIDLAPINAATIDISYPDRRAYAVQQFTAVVESEWPPYRPTIQVPGKPPIGTVTGKKAEMHAVFPTVKLFCQRCDRVEPYNLATAHDLFALIQGQGGNASKRTLQTFAVAYVCQSCKGTPEIFLIRRDGLKLTLVGRSPIEHVDVPPVIPKNQRKYFGGAIIAFQSGQILPALFMLRTFIEQFAASEVNLPGSRADEVVDRYMVQLPEPVRAHFPSPREIYGKLSEAIHSAREDASLFESALAEVVEHFEARRLYKVGAA